LKNDSIRGINEESLKCAAQLVKAGELIVVPTDTVYGVACNPFDSSAIDKLFRVKQRPRTKSIQVLLPDLDGLADLGLSLPQPLETLSATLLPGGFSPICTADKTSRLATLRHDSLEDGTEKLTQAIRVPDFGPLHEILSVCGPLAATSANLSGHTSATSAQEAYESLGEGVALYLDAGSTPGSVPSTVVAANDSGDDGVEILREGVIPAARIHEILKSVAGGR
jgi:tRNA threonylcarbamoyl adenosine modification protein (Sua5/YciO/YrdC/YwlC family)